MPSANDEYVFRRVEVIDAPLIARQRASMFLDMGSVSREESELLRKACEPWLADLIAKGEYAGWVVEHGRGLARRIMKTLLNWCQANAIDHVTLTASGEGRPLYESLGFKPASDMQLVVL